MQLLAARIAPMAEVFESRIQSNTVMHVSVMSTTSKFLDGLARVFDHAVRSPLVALRLDAEALEAIAKQEAELVAAAPASTAARAQELAELMDTATEGVEKSRRHLSQFIDDFKEDISGFSELGGFRLRDLLAETADVARRSILKPDDDIRIDVSGSRSAQAYCSRLLKQHVYSLLTNAVYSIKDRLEEDSSTAGLITINIARPSAPRKSQERNLNRRWLVTIRDNGTGVSPEDLERLRAFEPGTHLRRSEPGQGYGLTAVHRYVESINGVLDLDSKQGEFFEVSLLLDEFNPKIHESAATRVK
jgi:signal transduction histidine kinase